MADIILNSYKICLNQSDSNWNSNTPIMKISYTFRNLWTTLKI